MSDPPRASTLLAGARFADPVLEEEFRQAGRPDGLEPIRWLPWAVASLAVAPAVMLAVSPTPLALGAPAAILLAAVGLLGGAAASRSIHRARRLAWLTHRAREEEQRARAALVRVATHEVLSPLAGMVAAAAELERSRLDGVNGALATAIRGDGAALHALLVEVLELARGEPVTVSVPSGPVSPAAALAEVARTLAPVAAARGVRLDVEAAEGVPAWIATDEQRLRHVLSQLAGHGVRRAAKGSVSLRCDAATAPDGRSVVAFTVADDGPGIPGSQLPGLFDPFRGVADADADGRSRLGLAVAQRMAQRMGGRVEVESGSGGPTRLRLVLPAAAITPGPTGPAVVARPPTAVATASRHEEVARIAADARALADLPTPHGAQAIAARAGALAREANLPALAAWAGEVGRQAAALDVERLETVLRSCPGVTGPGSRTEEST